MQRIPHIYGVLKVRPKIRRHAKGALEAASAVSGVTERLPFTISLETRGT